MDAANARRGVTVAACALLAFLARAQLSDFIQNVDAGSRLEGVFFRLEPLPSGAIPIRRPPAETRPALDSLVATSPNDAELCAARAREAEFALDFAAAEADWRKHAQLAADPAAGQLALADFYHRRLQPLEEIGALNIAAKAPSPSWERLTPPAEQRSWRTFQRTLALIDAQALGLDTAAGQYCAWMARYPSEAAVHKSFFDFLLARKRWAEAEAALDAYQRAFPADAAFVLEARATLEQRRGSAPAALAVFERSFDPLWPRPLVKTYFALLAETRSLGRVLDRARAALAENPDDLKAAARLYHYHQQQGDLSAAHRVLADFRLRKEARRAAWSAAELTTLARLAEAAQDYDEAARFYYALYSLPAAGDQASETALAGLARLLLAAPEQPIRFGAGDLSLYRDIATLDPYPGFLNGVLSLLFNSTGPAARYREQEQSAAPYFHRARAAHLVTLLETRFPASRRLPALRAALLDACAAHGASDCVIRAGRDFLARFPDAPERLQVSLLMAEAHARLNQTAAEFAVYDALLEDLTRRAGPPARSPQYIRVLDRYISRLVAMKRTRDALALYRREIDRVPDDPTLYERLAAFLEQNKLAQEVEEVYRRAMERFPTRAWHHKLARWYLRHKQHAEFDRLTADVVKIFSGTEIEVYLREATGQTPLDPVLYRQVNLYAHQRFPHHLAFVHNLLIAYSRKGTADPAAWERLVRRYWYYDDDLRARLFELLSRGNRLEAELNAPPPDAAGAAWLRFVAEADLWRSRYESAGPRLRAVSAAYPGDDALARRAATLARSLGEIKTAVALEERLLRLDPRNTQVLTRLGEIHADRDDFERARPWWDRITGLEPGRPDGYLEAATVFWDYYQYDDALRVIAAARSRLGDPSLFAYEAGAIHENRRDYPRAFEEYVRGAAAATDQDSPARSRLLELARRPAHRDLAERASARDPFLLAAVLEAQNRRADLERHLLAQAASTGSLDVLTRLRGLAARLGLDAVHQRTLERAVALSTDAAERIRAQLELARFHEGRKDLNAARGVIEALEKNHPAILGVVRAAADFHWRTGDRQRSIEVLLRASKKAYASLSADFAFEAASKLTETARYDEARKLLAELLKREPGRAGWVAAMAETYARQRDYSSLRAFYSEKIQSVRDPERAAALRRDLIPVLARLGDHAAALGQYIELLDRYPEDQALVREAARYAAAHERRRQLVERYTKAASDAPRDFRWPMVLARLETHFENYDAAIAAFSRALAVRPDRADLLEARATLEERLMRFDQAAASFEKLYELTYHNPHWMEKVAETRARQGRNDEVVKALRRAYLEGRPERAQDLVKVASRLEYWNMLGEARPFAERGIELAGADDAASAWLYARVMTRLRLYEAAWPRVPPDGAAVRQFYTPAEKAAFAAFLDKNQHENLLGVVQAAGLADLEARWLYQWLLARPGQPETQPYLGRLVWLQQRRMRHAELGAQLEAYWRIHPLREDRDRLLQMAAENYALAGDEPAELRALSQQRGLAAAALRRYFALLRSQQPETLLARASSDYAAVNFALESGDAELARRAIAARGRALPPVWTSAYTALAGLFYSDPSGEADSAFRQALGELGIGPRLGRPADRSRQLAGDFWFYYASHYGEYLAARRHAQAEDYLPAALEGAPASAQAYFELAEYYRASGDAARAASDYEHALELDPRRGDAHNRLAAILWEQDQRDQALARWRSALEVFARSQEERRPPPAFGANVRSTLEAIGARKLFPPLAAEAGRLLETWIRRNGNYGAEPLLRGALAAAGPEWVADLSRAAADPVVFLGALIDSTWFPKEHRDLLFRRLIETAEAKAAQSFGEQRAQELSTVRFWRLRWIEHLIETGQAARAQAALDAVPEETRLEMPQALVPLELRIAARAGTLAALLERYRRDPPPGESLRSTAATLREQGDAPSARRLLEFVYSRELEAGALTAPNFLGLAEVKLEEKDPAGALALLRRMTLVAGEPFAHLDDAARLLEQFGRTAEAAEFREARRKALPWTVAGQAPPAPLPAALPALLDAVAGEPDNAAARLALFEAARKAGRHHLVVAALEPLLESGGLRYLIQFPRGCGVENGGPYHYIGGQFLAAGGLGKPARAVLAAGLADSLVELDRPEQGCVFYRIALELAPSAAVRSRLARQAALGRLREENERRRPVVGAQLEQPWPVRPRLTKLEGGGPR